MVACANKINRILVALSGTGFKGDVHTFSFPCLFADVITCNEKSVFKSESIKVADQILATL